MKASTKLKNTIPSKYKELMEMHIIRPIHDDVVYKNSLEMLYQLMKIEKMNEDQSDYFDLLSEQREKYEDQHYPIDDYENDPIENIKSLMKEHNMPANAQGRLLGSPELGSRILNRKRKLNVSHIQKLSNYFNLNPSYFFPKNDGSKA